MTSSPDISVSLSPPFLGAPGNGGTPNKTGRLRGKFCPQPPPMPPKKGRFGLFGRVSGQITCPSRLFFASLGSTTERQSRQPWRAQKQS
jgi:hypothetical protein